MTVQDKFWDWFIRHEAKLFHLDPNREAERERTFDELGNELQCVDPDLVFEFGPSQPRREFVVSAAGKSRAFPAVLSLVAAAPPLERWRVVAFRPRRTPLNAVAFRGKRVDPKNVQFSLLDNGKTAGIHLFIPGFHEADADWKQIGYLLLDDALGEYDVESRLGLIKMLPSDARTEEDRHPLAQLPALFDRLVSRLDGSSGKAS